MCSTEERTLFRFRTPRGWVNDDRKFLFGWTTPLINQISHFLFTALHSLVCGVRHSQWYFPPDFCICHSGKTCCYSWSCSVPQSLVLSALFPCAASQMLISQPVSKSPDLLNEYISLSIRNMVLAKASFSWKRWQYTSAVEYLLFGLT